MNKRGELLTIIASIIIIIGAISGCNNKEINSVYNSIINLSDPIFVTKNSLNISIDPRIELLSIVQYLSNYEENFYGRITDYDFTYRNKVDEYFEEFKDHEAVKLSYELSHEGFNFDAPPAAVLYMTKDFQLRDDVEIEDYLIERAKGIDNINKLFNALNKFWEDTKFNDFFNENKEYYTYLVKNTSEMISDEKNIVEELEQYYGIKQESYNVILVSLYGPGGYGPRVKLINKNNEIYSIIGATNIDANNRPIFGDEDYFDYIQNHEFSHSFINPLTEKYLDIANEYSSLYNPIEDKMLPFGYTDWEISLNEHIIRALTSRFSYLENNLSGKNALLKEKEDGFIYIDKLFEKLEEYEDNRDKYPTIDSFYPELIKSLDYYVKNNQL